MRRFFEHIPLAGIIAFMVAGKASRFDTGLMRMTTVIISVAVAAAVYLLGRKHQASPIHKGMLAFLLLAGLSVWMWPSGAGQLCAKYPAAVLYAVLFLVAVGPPILGRDVFTMYFARKTTPEAVWETDVFKRINYHLTALWAVLFFCGMVLGSIPEGFDLHGPLYEMAFEGLLPAVLMLTIGAPANKRYPIYYQRKLGLTPVGNGVLENNKDLKSL
jgi:hypothetical protein